MGPRARDVLAAVTDADVSQRGLPVRHLARRSTIAGAPGARAAHHLCRRARLGAACAGRVRRRRVYDALMAAGRAAWPRQCRLPRDRIAAAGEGLSRLGRRHRPGPHAARGGPRLGGEAAARTSRSSAARRWTRSRPHAAAASCSPASPSTIPTSCCSAARRSIATASASAGCPAAASATRSAGARLRLRAQPGRRRRGLCAGGQPTSSRSPTERVPAQPFLKPPMIPAIRGCAGEATKVE